MTRLTMCVCLLALTLFALAPQAKADYIVLEDGNSMAAIDTASDFGMYYWLVDGVKQLKQQWFWYRVGSDTPQSAINTLPNASYAVSDTNGDGKNDVANLKYSNDAFEIVVKYSLNGSPAGSLQSDMGEQIQINNRSGRAIDDFHFFQYSDFDLGSLTGGQTVQFVTPGKVEQTGGGTTLSETVVVPNASRHEASSFPTTLLALRGSTPYDLNNTDSATGDATWAFQWDFNLAASGAGSSFGISKDKLLSPVVPEPASILLMGGILLLVARKFRKA